MASTLIKIKCAILF